MTYPPTELVLDSKNRVYHLGASPENIAENVILVGDQDRVDLIAQFFENIEYSSQHREFKIITGKYKDKRISAISTGIGTDNIDITINELDALVNINLETKKDKTVKTSLNLVRIGTCGILQPEIDIDSYILSSHSIGLDNVAHFYDIEFNNNEKNILADFQNQVDLPKHITPYCSEASERLKKRLSSNLTHEGITVTSSGFYGPQGRTLRLGTKTSDLNEKLQSFDRSGLKILNFEMESSALFALGKALGHNVSTICLGIANRPNLKFSSNYESKMTRLIEYVLDRI